MTYKLDPPIELESIHPIFHVPMLKKYVLDSSHVFPQILVKLDSHLGYEEWLVAIVD